LLGDARYHKRLDIGQVHTRVVQEGVVVTTTPEWAGKVWWLQPHQSEPGKCGGYNHTRVGQEGVVVTTTPEWARKVGWLQQVEPKAEIAVVPLAIFSLFRLFS